VRQAGVWLELCVLRALVERLPIAAGGTAVHTFTLNVTRALWLINRAYQQVLEPGDFVAYVGPSSGDLRLNTTFTVVAGEGSRADGGRVVADFRGLL